jgi:hypothetical protein
LAILSLSPNNPHPPHPPSLSPLSSNPYKKRCDLLPASSDKASLEKLIVELKGSPLGPSPDAAANPEAAVAPPFKKKAKKDPEEEAKSKERKIAKYLEEEQLPKVEKQLAVRTPSSLPVLSCELLFLSLSLTVHGLVADVCHRLRSFDWQKIERSKKKANLAAIAAAQAEVRTTRTRTRQKRGVNYNNGSEEFVPLSFCPLPFCATSLLPFLCR